MTKSWPLLALAALGAVAALFCLEAFDWTAWACRLPTGDEGKVLTPGVGGCVEYWLNRYQTLMGALVAIGAAGFAWRGVMMQVASAEKQVAAGRRQSAIALLDMLYSRVDDFRDLANKIVDIRNHDCSAARFRKAMISSLKSMTLVADNQPALYDEYNHKFLEVKRSYGECLTELEENIRTASIYFTKAMISSQAKINIGQYIDNAKHAVATHNLADELFNKTRSIIASPFPEFRKGELEKIVSELDRVSALPDLRSHPGYDQAILAVKNMSEVVDNALFEAEGRSE